MQSLQACSTTSTDAQKEGLDPDQLERVARDVIFHESTSLLIDLPLDTLLGNVFFLLDPIDTSSLLVTCRGIAEVASRVWRGRMDGIVLGYEYHDGDEDDIERSKTVAEWKREYRRQYYLVSDWSKIHAM